VRFENSDELRGAEFVDVDLSGARFHNVNMSGAHLKEAQLVNARISGLIIGLTVNDVEVAPLIVAELDRRYPERTQLRPTDAEGVRAAWSLLESLWAETMARAAALPEDVLHERVDGEWSFLETVRHLVFVIDLWIAGKVLGRSDQDHFHPLGMPPSFMKAEDFGIDASVDPPLADVVAARADRNATVRALVDGLTHADLERQCGDDTLLGCLLVLFDEEWHHRWFATRDLDTLTRGR
jgi:uncharacterized protein YjbI with pentapeptide repeats